MMRNTPRLAGPLSALAVAGLLLAITGCDAAGVDGSASVLPDSPATAAGFESCASPDANHLCVALRVATFTDDAGEPIVAADDLRGFVAFTNDTFKACDIAFEVDTYEIVDPAARALPHGGATQSGSTTLRRAFASSDELTVVLTDSWGSTNVGSAEMPGGTGPWGSLVDAEWALGAGVSGQITFAHELGHDLGLDHDASSNLMYSSAQVTARGLTDAQCAAARSTATGDWRAMLRRS